MMDILVVKSSRTYKKPILRIYFDLRILCVVVRACGPIITTFTTSSITFSCGLNVMEEVAFGNYQSKKA